jgi:hypothetical protein
VSASKRRVMDSDPSICDSSGWAVVAVSVRGPAHKIAGVPCQDRSNAATVGNTALLCVADGAGSSQYGGDGAAIAVKTVLARLLSENPDTAKAPPHERAAAESSWIESASARIRDAMVAARSEIKREAEDRGKCLAEFACTLVVGLIRPGGLAVGQIGDGGIVAKVDGELAVRAAAARGEYANEAVFLTSEGWAEVVSIRHWQGRTEAACAFTDGCQRACLQRGDPPTPFEAFFAPLWEFVGATRNRAEAEHELGEMLSSDRFREHSDDDKSLAVAAWVPG